MLTAALAAGCSTLTIEADASWRAAGNTRYVQNAKPYTGSIGRLAVLFDVPVNPALNARIGVEHRSFIETDGDRGDERAFVGLKWRPFAKEGAN